MPKTYDDCPKEVPQIATAVMKRFDRHKPLLDAGVTVGFWFAYGDPAILVHGRKAAAQIKIHSLLDRLKTGFDAACLIDGEEWKGLTDNQRMSLLDHELFHLQVSSKGKRDDLGRPVLETREHDHQFGWFRCVAESWGADSYECRQARTLMDTDGQIYWPGIINQPADARKAARRLVDAMPPGSSIEVGGKTVFEKPQ